MSLCVLKAGRLLAACWVACCGATRATHHATHQPSQLLFSIGMYLYLVACVALLPKAAAALVFLPLNFEFEWRCQIYQILGLNAPVLGWGVGAVLHLC